MIELREIKTHLKIEHPREDYYLVGLEEQAVAYLERQTSAYYGPPSKEPIELVVPGTGTVDLPVPGPVHRIVELTESPDPFEDDGEEIPVDEGLYDIGFGTLVRRYCDVWDERSDYTLRYYRGYPAGEEPGDVRTAVMQIVCHWYERRNAVGTGAALPLSAESVILSRRRQRA